MRCHWHRMHDFAFENRTYLGEVEAEFKKVLARDQGQGFCRKSRDTVPLYWFQNANLFLWQKALKKVLAEF
jgi:hypothetical protein